METRANSDATQSSSVNPYPWVEGKFEPIWGTWKNPPAPDPYDPSWGEATQRWERNEREKVTTDHSPPAQPKNPKHKHEQRAQRRLRKTVASDKNEDISEEERDLSMYRLSDEDSDSSLTIYHKAYNKNKPVMNESSSESTEPTQRIKVEIAHMKEARKRKQDKKKRQRKTKRQRQRTKDTTPDKQGYQTDSDDDPAIDLRVTPPATYRRTAWQWTEKLEDYLNCPQHILLDTQHLL
jgi:hypothetical protein